MSRVRPFIFFLNCYMLPCQKPGRSWVGLQRSAAGDNNFAIVKGAYPLAILGVEFVNVQFLHISRANDLAHL